MLSCPPAPGCDKNRSCLNAASCVPTPLTASPNQAMRVRRLKTRAKTYELIKTAKKLGVIPKAISRRITVKSINDDIERRLAAEAVRRGRDAIYGYDQSRPVG